VPPYKQVAADIRHRIDSGEITRTVPGITRLMQEYGVARTTARKALLLLRDEGVIRIVPSWGSFVSSDDSGSAS
jgi:DNA-binding GntR family transcriptional regulator